MIEASAHQVALLLRWSEGEHGALDKLIPLVYDQLHRLAERYMAYERPGHTLQTTVLVNEAYLRLVDPRRPAGKTAPSSLPCVRSSCGAFWWIGPVLVRP
jgi:hypothetical protein